LSDQNKTIDNKSKQIGNILEIEKNYRSKYSKSHVVFVIDESGSMCGTDVLSGEQNMARYEAAINSCINFVQDQIKTESKHDVYSLITFDDKANISLTRVNLENISNNLEILKKKK